MRRTKTPKKKRPKLRVSILYVIMTAVMISLGGGYECAVYTVAVVLHELAHAEASERLGYTLTGFKLMPYGASLTGDYEGVRFKDEVIIAVAGPLFNLFLAVPAVALWWLVPQSYYITELFVTACLFIAAFNLVPVFPLDGGRVLLAVLSQKMSRAAAYRRVRIGGYIFSGLLIALFILSLFYKVNFTFALTAVFIFISTVIPDKNSYYQRLYSMAYRTEKLKRGFHVREILVAEDSTVLKLTKLLNGSFFTRFTVVNKDFKPLFTVNETDLEAISLKAAPSDTIAAAFGRTKK